MEIWTEYRGTVLVFIDRYMYMYTSQVIVLLDER